MNKIQKMLKDQKLGKRVRIGSYYNDEMNFWDDFERCKFSNLKNEQLCDELQILANTVREYNDENVFYLEGELPFSTSNYKEIFQNLIKQYLIDKEIAYHKAYEYKKSIIEFNKLIDNFKDTYVNADLYLDILKDLSNYISKESENYMNPKTRIKYANIELIKKIYDSNLSIIDYSFYNRITYGDLRNIYSNLSKADKEKYLEIKQRQDNTLRYILIILDQIKNNDISLIEYYELTKLDPFLLQQVARENNMYDQAFSKFFRLLKYNTPVNIESELKSKLIISQEEISAEMKQEAYDYLKAIEAPTNTVVYKEMIRKLMKEKHR